MSLRPDGESVPALGSAGGEESGRRACPGQASWQDTGQHVGKGFYFVSNNKLLNGLFFFWVFFLPEQIIVERAQRSRAPDLDKKKYLVPSDLTGTINMHSAVLCLFLEKKKNQLHPPLFSLETKWPLLTISCCFPPSLPLSGPAVLSHPPACVVEARGGALLLRQQLHAPLQLSSLCSLWGEAVSLMGRPSCSYSACWLGSTASKRLACLTVL